MKKLFIAILILFVFSGQAISAVPYTFTNGTIADATEVNSNMNYFENKFSSTSGHDHDGSDSKTIISVAGVSAGTLSVANGGTGNTSYASADMVYATGDTTALAKLNLGTIGSVMIANRLRNEPGWLAPGTSGQFLQTQGNNLNPVWAAATSFTNRGDPAAADFTQANITGDNTWRDLDLSAAVPSGAVAILLNIVMNDGSTYIPLEFRRNGNANAIAVATLYTPPNAGSNWGYTITVPCDSNRIIEYRVSEAITSLTGTVLGWF